MKKSIVLLLMLVLALGLAPLLGQANDIPDGADCAAETDPVTLQVPPDPTTENGDRGFVCVSDGDDANGAELYVGGELQAEEEGNPDLGNACGAVIVGGMALQGDPDWDNDNGTPDDTSDDNHCD